MSHNIEPLQRPNFITAFREHPASVGETYFQHMGFAISFGLSLIGAGLAAFVHALIPPLFETTASRILIRLHARICERKHCD